MLRTALLSAAAMLMLSLPATAQAQHHEESEAAASQPSASIPMTESHNALAQEDQADELAQNAPQSSDEPTPYGLQGHLDAEGNHITQSIPADEAEQPNASLARPDEDADDPDQLAQSGPLPDEQTAPAAQGDAAEDADQLTQLNPPLPTPADQQ